MNDEASAKLLEEVRSLLKDEGVNLQEDQSQEELIEKFILPSLDASKDIQRHLYTDFTSSGGAARKVKNKVINKIANITRNTVEKSFMRQQKFNDNVLKLLKYLLAENKSLRAELGKIKQNGK